DLSAPGKYFDGSIDDVRIYDQALTEAQLVEVMDANTPPPPPPDDRVGHWKLDETSGTTAADSSNESNDGTFVSSPVWQAPGLDFDGTDDYVTIGNEPVLDFGTGDFTICAWISTTVGGDIFTKGWDGVNGVRYEFNIGTTIKMELDDNSNKKRAYGTTTVNDGQWYHVAIVRDGTTLRTYTGGVPEGTLGISAGYNLAGTSQGSAYIGVIYNNGDSLYNSFFNGVIDDVRIFDVALSEQDIDDIIAE
ncbi:MAG: LamG domain-containing protein, partial [Planctomycetes bacterium]|nr:LamG domain-containing protein [Planctomycetota bacterium]